MPLFGPGSSSSQSSVGPPPPALPRTARPEGRITTGDADSHAQFLFEQARATLRQLHARGNLQARDYADICQALNRAELKDDDPLGFMQVNPNEASEEQLGKRNAWMRKTLAETSLLPAIVSTVLSVTAGPLLSDTQQQAIMDLVQRSQATIARMVTNPNTQRLALQAPVSGAKVVGKGLTTGYSTVRDSSSAMLEKRREDSRSKREQKAARKQLREELKRERAEIVRMRQKNMLEGGEGSSARDDEFQRRDRELQGQEAALGPEEGDADDDDGEDDGSPPDDRRQESRAMSSGRLVSSPISASPSFGSFPQRNLPPAPTGSGSSSSRILTQHSSHSQNGAVAAVQCFDTARASDDGGMATSAATTSFSPWPGLLLTSTLVVASGSDADVGAKAAAIASLADGDERGVSVAEHRRQSRVSVSAQGSALPSTATSSRHSSISGPSQSGPSVAQAPPPPEPRALAPTPSTSAAAPVARASAPPPPVPQAARSPLPPVPEPAPVPAHSRTAPPPPAPTAPDPTAPPPFGAFIDTTEQKTKKGSGLGKLFK